eukprot:9209-Eustigmatos_ZCMA.PRE.1
MGGPLCLNGAHTEQRSVRRPHLNNRGGRLLPHRHRPPGLRPPAATAAATACHLRQRPTSLPLQRAPQEAAWRSGAISWGPQP